MAHIRVLFDITITGRNFTAGVVGRVVGTNWFSERIATGGDMGIWDSESRVGSDEKSEDYYYFDYV